MSEQINEPDFSIFEKKEFETDFLKMEIGQETIVSIKNIETFLEDALDKQGNPVLNKDSTQKKNPKIRFYFDERDGQKLTKNTTFTTGNHTLIQSVKEWHSSKILYTWLFKIKKEKSNNPKFPATYVITPVKQK